MWGLTRFRQASGMLARPSSSGVQSRAMNFLVGCGKLGLMSDGLGASAVGVLYRAHFDAIFGYAARRVGREAGLDVAAETFAQVLRHPERIDPERDARAWLFGIATNVLRHRQRGEMRQLRAYARVVAAESRAEAEDGLRGVREDLVHALARLDRGDREALLLFAWADLSYEQIAQALEVPVGTVRSRIHRARRLLRAELTVQSDAVPVSEGV